MPKAKVASYITLRCPKCRRTKSAKRDSSDPPGTVTVEIQCPKCNPGDFDSPAYFDARGKELFYTEEAA